MPACSAGEGAITSACAGIILSTFGICAHLYATSLLRSSWQACELRRASRLYPWNVCIPDFVRMHAVRYTDLRIAPICPDHFLEHRAGVSHRPCSPRRMASGTVRTLMSEGLKPGTNIFSPAYVVKKRLDQSLVSRQRIKHSAHVPTVPRRAVHASGIQTGADPSATHSVIRRNDRNLHGYIFGH